MEIALGIAVIAAIVCAGIAIYFGRQNKEKE